jgi:hypothetical protein
MKGTILATYIEGIRSRKDKTMALTLGTNELTPEKAGELFSLNGKLITAYLSPSDVSKEDVSLIDSLEPEMPGKSLSQRLRSVLYLMWEQNNEGYKDKNMHYQHYMENIINHFKTKLQ